LYHPSRQPLGPDFAELKKQLQDWEKPIGE
jgi:hypothetical protein